jgi:Ser/Thr protein kinase RdoA (MazF antagonist)
MRLSADDADEVCAAYGLPAPEGPMDPAARGELGRIWRLPTGAGPVAVKDLFVPPTPQRAAADVAFQLTAAAAGIVLPEPLLRPDGAVLTTLRSGAVVRAYRWVELTPLGVVPVAELARVLAVLHRSAPPAVTAPHPWYTEPVGEEGWARLAGADARLDAFLPEQLALEALLLPAAPRGDERCCHLDLDPSNLARDPDGRFVVLDWENCGPCSPARELAQLAVQYGRAFTEGYLSAGGPARLGAPDDFALAAAVQGHLLELYATRLRTPARTEEEQEDRQRAEHHLTEILAVPVTPARITELLR